MTDTLASSTTLHGSELNPLHSRTISEFHYRPAHTDVTVEDDGQISCFCGLNEDDGNTVACDSCNKWQHIRCYYPQWAEGNVPDDLQHFCLECKPHTPRDPLDARFPLTDVRQRRDLLQNGATKRPASKTKKKPALNGWPLDKRHDRTSASPREQGPPTKRPKTTHRTSNSTNQARKRSASTIHPRSASGSPETISQTYSPEFISTYQNDAYTTTSANCFDSLEVGAKLSGWLSNPEEIWEISGGLGLHDIFQRYDGDMAVIDPPIDMIELHETYDDRVKTIDGQSPMWKFATVKDPTTAQSCLGELRGHVGFKEDYKAEPANRWTVLRHPEPFVFFHPHLPIYIDARNEGTMLRYVRRSCVPNTELKVIITGSVDYHFCFMALRDIEVGEEVAIAWDCARTMADLIRGPKISKDDINSVQRWISILLSNCGPCACKRSDCLMERFDKRFTEETDRPPKTKARRKKDLQHISPLNTHALNSRSGSEVRRFDDDDRDSRSATGSGKGSDSRDITPNTHYSTNGHTEVSERERKKLAKEEEMFRRQEEQAIGKRKKRTSGGNTLDIPKSASSKQSPGLPKRMDTANGRVSSKSVRRPKSATTPKTVKAVHSAYVDSEIQCEMDEHETIAYVKQTTTCTRRRMTPLHQRLLERCAQVNAAWKSSQRSPRRVSKSTDDGDTAMTEQESATTQSEPTSSSPITKPVAELPSSAETLPRPAVMKLDMPPPATNPFAAAQPWSAGTPVSLSGILVESPAVSGPLSMLSPSVQGSLSTPIKKKMSLSDYTKRSKAKETTEIKADRESSPSSTVSGPITAVQPPGALAAVGEDAVMEDVAAQASEP